MRDAPRHDAPADQDDPPRRRPVWPETVEDHPLQPSEGDPPENKHREQSLAERSAALQQARRELAESERQFQERQAVWESKSAAAQAELNGRLERCEELIAQLEREQEALDAERAEIESCQGDIRQAVLAELAADQQRLAGERESLQSEKQEFRKRVEAHEREISSTSGQWRAEWDTEREALREQLTAKLALELSQERRALDDEYAAWETERDREREALESERIRHEHLIAKAHAELDEHRAEQAREFQERRRALEEEIGTQVERLESKIAEQQASWEADHAGAEEELQALRQELEERERKQDDELAAARTEFERFREHQLRRIDDEAHARLTAFEEDRAAWIAEREAARDRLATEAAALDDAKAAFAEECRAREADLDRQLDERRAAVERELSALRDEFDEQCVAERRAIDEERAVAQNRILFQEDHLERTRGDLEEARRVVDLRVQQARAQAVGMANVARLRLRQLDQFRERLDQREASLERERQALAEIVALAERDRVEAQQRRQGDAEWDDRDREPDRLAEQTLRDELASRAGQLAERQARLETLRVEIDSNHRENLELRMALDDAWARLTQQSNPQKARDELRLSRETVAEFFRTQDAAIQSQRKLLGHDAEAARAQSAQLDRRRRELTDWLEGNLSSLRRREEELRRWAAALESREERAAREARRWQKERLDVEQLIRDLLDQLGQASGDEPRIAGPEPIAPPPNAIPLEQPLPHRAAG